MSLEDAIRYHASVGHCNDIPWPPVMAQIVCQRVIGRQDMYLINFHYKVGIQGAEVKERRLCQRKTNASQQHMMGYHQRCQRHQPGVHQDDKQRQDVRPESMHKHPVAATHDDKEQIYSTAHCDEAISKIPSLEEQNSHWQQKKQIGRAHV